MKKLVWALLPFTLVAASVSGCSTQLARPIALANMQEATEIDAAMVVVEPNTCPKKTTGDKAFTGVESVIVGTAVDFGVNLLGEWIKTQQVRRNAVWSASGTITSCKAPYWQTRDARKITVRRAVVGADGQLKAAPGFELTGDLSFDYFPTTDDEGAGTVQLTWKSQKFAYGRTAAPARGSKRKHVVVLLGFAPSAMLKTGDAATGKEELPGVIRLDLGYVQDGHFYSEGLLRQVEAVSTIAAPSNDTLNVTAVVVETEDESLALKALSAAFESNKDALGAAVKDDLGVSEDQ